MTEFTQTATKVPSKELTVATIHSVEPGKIVLIAEMDGKEYPIELKPTPKVEEFLSNSKVPYGKGKVVEYSAKGGVVSLIRPVGGFKKGVDVRAVIDAELEQRKSATEIKKFDPIPPQGVSPIAVTNALEQHKNHVPFAKTESIGIAQASLQTQAITPSPTAVNVTVTGSFNPAKIHGYEISDTCQMVQFEPITIKVICDDPEEGRRALVAAWGIFGQHNELVRDNVTKHIERSLMKILP